jgi:hypothetical protein
VWSLVVDDVSESVQVVELVGGGGVVVSVGVYDLVLLVGGG